LMDNTNTVVQTSTTGSFSGLIAINGQYSVYVVVTRTGASPNQVTSSTSSGYF
jgi:hypothetical protein